MMVTALCFTLTLNVLLLSASKAPDGALGLIVPSRLQVFEHESLSLDCESLDGWAGWRVCWRTSEGFSTCSHNSGRHNIRIGYTSDSGEYWCEGGGRRSNTVNITVTDGSVILESPVRPLMEGDAVTLRCRNSAPSHLPADFYKDGRLFQQSSTAQITISAVSKSDEGLYRCNISGSGQSAESLMMVTERSFRYPECHKETHPSSHNAPWIAVTSLLVALLLAVGLFYIYKNFSPASLLQSARGLALCFSYMGPTSTSSDQPREHQPVPVEAGFAELTYATVNKQRKTKEDDGTKQLYYTLSPVAGVSICSGRAVATSGTAPRLTVDEALYSAIR
ncbi:low affinity immunoglobulin gamma Fc region receptor III-A-like isoform X2 [Genypterus blacodes]|uniref:low affinity immunoglobulin gamma Fc region receptor III-A-like isoform X2 n=1 Tax=Genypterus blacodes TaxID=154954 RepID=UPI003F760989